MISATIASVSLLPEPELCAAAGVEDAPGPEVADWPSSSTPAVVTETGCQLV